MLFGRADPVDENLCVLIGLEHKARSCIRAQGRSVWDTLAWVDRLNQVFV